VIDTAVDRAIENVETISPNYAWARLTRLRGANPNGLALAPDEGTLYVTNGGANSVALVQVRGGGGSQVTGPIPTGWYPNAVSVSADSSTLYIVNGKGVPGPNAHREYVWELTYGGLLPVRAAGELANRTRLETGKFNLVMWQGLIGRRKYPVVRDGRDLRHER
jgi:YVTN family beta-propeller protein